MSKHKPRTEEQKKKLSQVTTDLWKNPEYRKHHIENRKKSYSNPVYRKKLSISLTQAHSNPNKYKNIFLSRPFICYYCGNIISTKGITKTCLAIHSLDGNHENWLSENKVPVHRGCHPLLHPVTLEIRKKMGNGIKSQRSKRENYEKWYNATFNPQVNGKREKSRIQTLRQKQTSNKQIFTDDKINFISEGDCCI